jgi:hypothetical protein
MFDLTLTFLITVPSPKPRLSFSTWLWSESEIRSVADGARQQPSLGVINEQKRDVVL